MKRVRIALALVVCMVFAFGYSPAQAAKELKFAHVYEPGTPYNDAALWIADEIAKRTNNKFTVRVYPSSQLGNEETLVEGLSMDSIQIAYAGPTFLGQFHAPMAISEAPYVWRGYDHWRSYQSSDLFAEVSDGFFKKTGNKVVAIIYFGERAVTANKDVLTPADMKGMKLRVGNATLWTIFPEAVGAQATPVSFAELYLALQQKVVDGQENPITMAESNKFFEVQSTINRTQHSLCSIVGMVGGPLWNSLNDAEQKVFDAVFKEAAANWSDKVRVYELKLFEQYAATNKMKVNAADIAAFEKLVTPKVKEVYGAELVERIQALPDTKM